MVTCCMIVFRVHDGWMQLLEGTVRVQRRGRMPGYRQSSSLAGDARKCGKQRAKGQVEVVAVEFMLM
jgi:hypothetical protein